MAKKNENVDELIDSMSKFAQSRWLALYEAVNIIADKAEDSGKKFDTITLKQPALEKYIESTCDGIYKCLEEREKRESKYGKSRKR